MNSFINFKHLSERELLSYYRAHLPSAQPSKNGLQACCPFHNDSRASMTINTAAENGGPWFCFGCHKTGNPLIFERLMAHQRGQRIHAQDAYQRIRMILVGTHNG